MLWLRISNILFLILPMIFVGPSSASKVISEKTVTEKLITIAEAIQNHEAQLSTIEHDLSLAQDEEKAILAELSLHNQRLMETIHYLRHATQYSPLLAMLSASKPEDVIHSSMLLRSITPEIHYRNQQLLEKIKTLSTIRADLEAKQNQLRDITFRYHQEKENLDSLLKDRSKSFLNKNEKSNYDSEETFTLIHPVVGKLIPTYKSTKPEWASFTQGILLSTRPGAHVITPLSGSIVFAGDYADGQSKIVIIQTSKSHIVMSGLDSLSCSVGQNMITGEPIGKMPLKNPTLYLEVWYQEQIIDPQSVLKEKRKAQP